LEAVAQCPLGGVGDDIERGAMAIARVRAAEVEGVIIGGHGDVTAQCEFCHQYAVAVNVAVRIDVRNVNTGREAGVGKRSLLNRFSILVLNKEIVEPHPESWTEDDIRERGKQLADTVISVWPRPARAAGGGKA